METKFVKPVRYGDIIEIDIHSLAFGGDSVGRYRDFAIFVPGGLPGERLAVKITRVKDHFATGEIVNFLKRSPDRIVPGCPVFEECGGCQWQHLHYSRQLQAKRQFVVDAFQRIGHLSNVVVQPSLPSPNPYAYRNKALPVLSMREGHYVSGIYEPRSHHLVPYQTCPIQGDAVNDLIQKVLNKIDRSGLTPYQEKKHIGFLRHLAVRQGLKTGEMILSFITRAEVPEERLQKPALVLESLDHVLPRLAAELMEEIPGLVGVLQNINPSRTNAVFGSTTRLLVGRDHYFEVIDDLRLRVSLMSFLQVNTLQADILHTVVREALGEPAHKKKWGILLDLFSGLGTLALAVSQKVDYVVGIEESAPAVEDAKFNATLNQRDNIDFLEGDVGRVLMGLKEKGLTQLDAAIMDPPRKGILPEVLARLTAFHPERLVYVSCDPSTLARDLSLLTKHGYSADWAQPIDMFPQTYHVETVVRLTRQKPLSLETMTGLSEQALEPFRLPKTEPVALNIKGSFEALWKGLALVFQSMVELLAKGKVKVRLFLSVMPLGFKKVLSAANFIYLHSLKTILWVLKIIPITFRLFAGLFWHMKNSYNKLVSEKKLTQDYDDFSPTPTEIARMEETITKPTPILSEWVETPFREEWEEETALQPPEGPEEPLSSIPASGVVLSSSSIQELEKNEISEGELSSVPETGQEPLPEWPTPPPFPKPLTAPLWEKWKWLYRSFFKRSLFRWTVLAVLFLGIGAYWAKATLSPSRPKNWLQAPTVSQMIPDAIAVMPTRTFLRYEMVPFEVRVNPKNQAYFSDIHASVEIFCDGEPVNMVDGRSKLYLKKDQAGKKLLGNWPIPYNPKAGTYIAEIAITSPQWQTPHTFESAFTIAPLKPHGLYPGYAALTMEGGKQLVNGAIPPLDGNGSSNTSNAIDWAKFIGANLFCDLMGQTSIWDHLVKADFPFNRLEIETGHRYARAAHAKGLKFASYMTTFKVEGDAWQQAPYEFSLGYDPDSDEVIQTRFISLEDKKRRQDVIDFLRKMDQEPLVDIIGMDYVRTGFAGYEMVDEFVKDLNVPGPMDFWTMSKQDRIHWLARTVELKENPQVVALFEWWRAHKVALTLKGILDEAKVSKPVFTFTLGWEMGHQHGQDPAMFIDAGVAFNHIMLYEGTREHIEVMKRHWPVYLSRENGMYAMGEMVDFNWVQRTTDPPAPLELFNRQNETFQNWFPENASLGMFWHDLYRLIWGIRGPYTSMEWAISGGKAFSALQHTEGLSPIDVTLTAPREAPVGVPVPLSVEIRNHSPEDLKGVILHQLDASKNYLDELATLGPFDLPAGNMVKVKSLFLNMPKEIHPERDNRYMAAVMVERQGEPLRVFDFAYIKGLPLGTVVRKLDTPQ